MAEKKLVEAITSMSEDFAQWYTDVVKKAELIDYSNVKGCMVIKPAGLRQKHSFVIFTKEIFSLTGISPRYITSGAV